MRRYSYFFVISSLFFGVVAESGSLTTINGKVDWTADQKKERQINNQFEIAAGKMSGTYIQGKIITEKKRHAKFIREAWNKLYKESLGCVYDWTEKNLKEDVERIDTLFYPFGGPDISYAISFFPYARRYILVGLEPLGDFSRIKKNLENPEYYDSLRTAFSTYLRKGYFVTSEMQTQLLNRSIKGGLNLIILALSKLGFTIQEIENCFIDTGGNVVKFDQNGVDCVRILCEKSLQKKEIFYVKADLTNESDKLNNLISFIRKFEFSTFIKSASYALHSRNFSKIRSFILNNTDSILQDDTGIPFNFFRQNWNIRVFGTYTEPTLPVFRTYKQNSLRKYYLKHKADTIPFPIGYGYIKRTPNLIFVVSLRKKLERQLKKLRNQLNEKRCSCYR